MRALPEGVRRQIERATAQALATSYGLAGRAPDLGERGPMVAAIAAGAAGGAGGLATAVAELPVTVTLLLNAIRGVAREAGLDPEADWVRAECLQVFAAGSPLAADDGVNTSFVASRLALTGSTVQNLIAPIAPKLAAVLGQKLAAQAVPVIGAISGATLKCGLPELLPGGCPGPLCASAAGRAPWRGRGHGGIPACGRAAEGDPRLSRATIFLRKILGCAKLAGKRAQGRGAAMSTDVIAKLKEHAGVPGRVWLQGPGR